MNPLGPLGPLALVAALAATAAPALAFVAQNNLTVLPEGPQSFHVRASPGQGAAESWCAAGDYAIKMLGVTPTTRIYRTSEPPRRQGQGVSFSLSPEGAASKTGLLVLGAEGASLNAATAQQFCWHPPRTSSDF